MTELDKLERLLNELQIAYEPISKRTVLLTTKPVFINDCGDGLTVVGWDYSGVWAYSADYVARMLDRKFREEAVNNPYLLRMQKEGAEDEPERKTVRKSRMRKKGNRRNRSKTSR